MRKAERLTICQDEYLPLIRMLAYGCYCRLDSWQRLVYTVDDLVQEGFAVVYDKVYPKYNPELDTKFITLLTRCLITRYTDIIRTANRHKRSGLLRKDVFYASLDTSEETDDGGYDGEQGRWERTPEADVIFAEGVRALRETYKDFVDLVLSECPRAWRARKKLLVQSLRANKANGDNGRCVLPFAGKTVAKFVGIENFARFKEIAYNKIK